MDAPVRYTRSRVLPRNADPLRAYEILAGGRKDTCLLESRDGNGRNDTQSLLLVKAAVRIESRARTIIIVPLSERGNNALTLMRSSLERLGVMEDSDGGVQLQLMETTGDLDELQRLHTSNPVDVLRVFAFGWNNADGSTPLLLPGQFSYDFLETLERLPEARQDNLQLPEMQFWLPEQVVRVDHSRRELELHSFGYGSDEHLDADLDQMTRSLKDVPSTDDPGDPRRVPSQMPEDLEMDLADAEYCSIVEKVKEHIVAGDVFQIVPSRTFRLPCPDPINSYRRLRSINPSPYLFYLSGPDHILFGSSPETCVRVNGDPKTVTLFPIAGTRSRGRLSDGSLDPDLDNRMEAELKLHGKELAEHMMLVDLARNDVARISIPGTRRVSRLLEIERYSHVMHLVSEVQGHLKPELDALHAYLATMNMGTLTGAPKVMASSLLRRYERDKRGAYGGAVGYLSSNGEMDTAIVIRSAVVKDGVAFIRAGAGIVYDSEPQAEADETRNKANAVVQAVSLAHEGSVQ
jgi:anthranilate synthase component 1